MKIKGRSLIKIGLLGLLICFSLISKAQNAYFIDGYHGGVWGHYPEDYTGYMIEQLKKHPNWKINLEIEPETWDRAKIEEKEAYKQLQELVKDQSSTARVEFVNPTYAQSYLFNISGESIIRQFGYGIQKTKEHFPTASFSTYSSEEPCFTSSLPQILTLFDFKYASLKNPNTCWGGYTRGFDSELVNWVGPDGTSILTVPRYEFESLKKGSTWETIANANSKEFIAAAFKHGLQTPIGMCLQDAEWRIGPWLNGDGYYKPSVYTTWTNYFETIVDHESAKDWKVSQEDIQVSLVWGSQVLQKIAQEVKYSENKIIQAENLATMSHLLSGAAWPQEKIDGAWKTLLLSQHHDCWIVPYNGKKNDTWADKVARWTDTTNMKSDEVIKASVLKLNASKGSKDHYLRLFNTTSTTRKEWVSVSLPADWNPKGISFINNKGSEIPVQYLNSDAKSVLVFAEIPPMGYSSYKVIKKANHEVVGAKVYEQNDGSYLLETDLYQLVLDPNRGGTITKFIIKNEGIDYIDPSSEYSFNELRGYFYDQNKFRSSTETKAKVSILENTGATISVKVEGFISDSPFHQVITLNQSQKRIDLSVNIDWVGQPKIGEFEEVNYKDTTLHKAFYNDKYKLQALFPVALKNQVLYKDAPFDVTKSNLENTFFSTWDSIKNNIILNWVDIKDEKSNHGLALFTDHTTSYTHGKDYPLGLVVQYTGKGLWGRDYNVKSNTFLKYAIIPHQEDWEEANIFAENTNWNQPILVSFFNGDLKENDYKKSLIHLDNDKLIVSSLNMVNEKLVMRLFNSSSKDYSGKVNLNLPVKSAHLTNLLNERIRDLEMNSLKNSSNLNLNIRKFGISNIQVGIK